MLVPAPLEEFGRRGFGVRTAVDGGRSPVWPLPIIRLAGAVLLTWIYLRTGSALLAGLMHAGLDATVPLTWGLDQAWVWQARAGVIARPRSDR